ncbi:MAG: hypothetical protein ACTSWL_00710 [Promethearchaeota archaeon]
MDKNQFKLSPFIAVFLHLTILSCALFLLGHLFTNLVFIVPLGKFEQYLIRFLASYTFFGESAIFWWIFGLNLLFIFIFSLLMIFINPKKFKFYAQGICVTECLFFFFFWVFATSPASTSGNSRVEFTTSFYYNMLVYLGALLLTIIVISVVFHLVFKKKKTLQHDSIKNHEILIYMCPKCQKIFHSKVQYCPNCKMEIEPLTTNLSDYNRNI